MNGNVFRPKGDRLPQTALKARHRILRQTGDQVLLRLELVRRAGEEVTAGSGALGLESLSRYAANATLLEMERSVAQQLQKNLATLKASNAKVVHTNTLAFLAQTGTPHQIVFVDPPFRQGLLEETLTLLENNGWLSDEALIYIESEVENGLPPVPANWHLYREICHHAMDGDTADTYKS